MLGVLTTIDAFLEELIDKLPKHDVEQLSKLRTYALALLYAYTHAQPAAATETGMQAVLRAGFSSAVVRRGADVSSAVVRRGSCARGAFFGCYRSA